MMNNDTYTKIQLFGASCCLYYMGGLTLGWWLIAGYVPPHMPVASPSEIAEIYQHNTLGIRAGMVICMFGAAAFIPFTATLAEQISLIEGRFGILSMSQMMGGLGNAILTFYPAVWWLMATFRPERNPELTQLLNDGGWLQFVGGLTLFLPVVLTTAVAAFVDKSDTPTFPRWVGYFSLWSFVLFLPGQLIFFFKTGPFAWNGLLALWVPFTVFFLWFIVIYIFLRKAIKRQQGCTQ